MSGYPHNPAIRKKYPIRLGYKNMELDDTPPINFLAANYKGFSELHVAVWDNNLEALKELLAKDYEIDINCIDNKGNTPIYVAAEKGNLEAFNLLKQKGADLTIIDSKQSNILNAAACGGNIEIIKTILVSNQHFIYQSDSLGIHCLLEAISNNKFEAFEYLVKCEADINKKDNQGCTILSLFSQLGLLSKVQLILKYGGNPHIRNDLNKLPIEYALDEKIKTLLKEAMVTFRQPPKSFVKALLATTKSQSYCDITLLF